MNIHYDRLKEIFSDNMCLLYTGTDSLKLFIKKILTLNEGLNNYTDTSNFSGDTIFPFEPGKNEKRFGMFKS